MRVWILCLLFLVSACAEARAPLISAWNVTNAEAANLQARIHAGHQADLDKVVEDQQLTREEKLQELDKVEATWHPAYRAFRILRAVLVSTRALLLASEPLTPETAAALIQDLLEAKRAVEKAIP